MLTVPELRFTSYVSRSIGFGIPTVPVLMDLQYSRLSRPKAIHAALHTKNSFFVAQVAQVVVDCRCSLGRSCRQSTFGILTE